VQQPVQHEEMRGWKKACFLLLMAQSVVSIIGATQKRHGLILLDSRNLSSVPKP
jgi:hypothetical protein